MVIKKNQGRYGFKNTNKTIKRNGIVDHHKILAYTYYSSQKIDDDFEKRINEEFKAKSNSASIYDEEEKKEQKKKQRKRKLKSAVNDSNSSDWDEEDGRMTWTTTFDQVWAQMTEHERHIYHVKNHVLVK